MKATREVLAPVIVNVAFFDYYFCFFFLLVFIIVLTLSPAGIGEGDRLASRLGLGDFPSRRLPAYPPRLTIKVRSAKSILRR